MKELGPLDRAVGHPIVAIPGSILALGTLIAAFYNVSWMPVALIACGIMVPVLKLARAREDYLLWKRQWDGMEGPRHPAKPRSQVKLKPWIGGLLLLGLFLFLAANANDPVYAIALAWLVIAGPIAGIVMLIMRWRGVGTPTPTAKAQSSPVAICVSRSLLPVRIGADAYRALPAHAKAALGG